MVEVQSVRFSDYLSHITEAVTCDEELSEFFLLLCLLFEIVFPLDRCA